MVKQITMRSDYTSEDDASDNGALFVAKRSKGRKPTPWAKLGDADRAVLFDDSSSAGLAREDAFSDPVETAAVNRPKIRKATPWVGVSSPPPLGALEDVDSDDVLVSSPPAEAKSTWLGCCHGVLDAEELSFR